MIRRPPRSTLFPAPTLSRSDNVGVDAQGRRRNEFASNDTIPPSSDRLDLDGFEVVDLSSCMNFPPGTSLEDRKSTRLNSSHANISYAVFCLKKKKKT